ncbi:MAG: 30S ribosomal protein S12 methylthiotransferase RimO [Oscillospiraceae bacterium]|nr:30S ribosomal protein S12 methylthiotransferase RimO [Oscillospiraceae bacterium]
MKNYTVGMISLGCPKNQVDSEIMLAKLCERGFEITDDPYGADVVIVNTCGFIDAAKQEAIDNILEMAELKKQGYIKALVVTGCLAERYKNEVIEQMPEIDAVVGIGGNSDIADICLKALEGEKYAEFPSKYCLPLNGQRVLSTPEQWAYIKIAEGCSNCCAYCAIPSIRGKYRSRDMEDIVAEAAALAAGGVKELIIIAQDTTKYGIDLYGELKLPELLRRLSKIDGIVWLRLLYCYPDSITDELLDEMRNNDKVCKYVDLPLQHADENVLRRMNRKGSSRELLALIKRIRDKVPGVVIRTTFITGFPGETQEEFNTLCEFVKEAEFDRLGCFAYSAEEGTKAAEMPDQIDEQTKIDRGDIIMRQQFDIFSRKQEEKIGNAYKVLVEGYDSYTDSYCGRSYMDAPEIDSKIYFTSSAPLETGEFVDVRIINTKEYDLIGEAVGGAYEK